MYKTKTTVIRTLAAVMVVVTIMTVLAGCSDSSTTDDASEFVYLADKIHLPDEIGNEGISDLLYTLGQIYFVSHSGETDDFGMYTMTSDIYSAGIDGTDLARLPDYTHSAGMTPDTYGEAFINSMYTDSSGNLWVVESWLTHKLELPLDFDTETDDWSRYMTAFDRGSYLRKLDSAGAQLLAVDLEALTGGMYSVNTVNADGLGNIYLSAAARDMSAVPGASSIEQQGYAIFVTDAGGNLQFTLGLNDGADELLRMADGSIAIPVDSTDESGTAVRLLQMIDFETQVLGETVSLPGVDGRVAAGSGDYDYLIYDITSLHGFTLGEERAEELLRWLDINISGVRDITALPDGRIAVISSHYNGGSMRYINGLYIVERVPRSELLERTVLTLAVFGLTDENVYGTRMLLDMIADFNRTNRDYCIEVVDYYEQYGWLDGLTKLNTEIISGNIPDIIFLPSLPFKDYAARGLFADLYPFIDTDPEFDRSDFVENIFRVAEIDGRLYRVFPEFKINTIIGHPSVVGIGEGWNINEFREVLDAHPGADIPLGLNVDKDYLLHNLVSYNMDEFIDWEAGTANFDTSDFIRLLEVVNTFPNEVEWAMEMELAENVAAGRQIMSMSPIGDFLELRYLMTVFGGEIVFKGYPNGNSNGNSIEPGLSLAITAACGNKEVAWTFVRTILEKNRQLDDNYYSMGFPTNQAAFDYKVKEALEEEPEISSIGGIELADLQKLTPEDMDRLIALINSIKFTSGDYGLTVITIRDIISESASDYFKSMVSAEDAARVTQSRISVLLAELN